MSRIQRGILILLMAIPFIIRGEGDAGRSGFDFLKTVMGARPAGMGGAYKSGKFGASGYRDFSCQLRRIEKD